MKEVKRASQAWIGFEELPGEALRPVPDAQRIEAAPHRPRRPISQPDDVDRQKQRHRHALVDLHRMARDAVAEVDALAGHRLEERATERADGGRARQQHDARPLECLFRTHEHGGVDERTSARRPALHALAGGRRRSCRVVGDGGAGADDARQRFQHGIDRRIVAQGQVKLIGAAHGFNWVAKRLGTVGLERLRFFKGAIPNLNRLAAFEHLPHEARPEQSGTKIRNHVRCTPPSVRPPNHWRFRLRPKPHTRPSCDYPA